MRIPTNSEYATAKAALAVYADFCKPYVQRNGWTVIPTDAPLPIFEGAPLDADRVNSFSTTVELFELDRDRPEKFSAYVASVGAEITSWTGEKLGHVQRFGLWHTNNFGARFRSLRVRADWGAVYSGREYDSRQLINLRRCAA